MGQERFGLGKNLIGPTDVLDQVEHENEIEAFLGLKPLYGTKEIAVPRALCGIAGAEVDIHNLCPRHARVACLDGIEKPTRSPANVERRKGFAGDLFHDSSEEATVKPLLDALNDAPAWFEGVIIRRVNLAEPVMQHRGDKEDRAVLAAEVAEALARCEVFDVLRDGVQGCVVTAAERAGFSHRVHRRPKVCRYVVRRAAMTRRISVPSRKASSSGRLV